MSFHQGRVNFIKMARQTCNCFYMYYKICLTTKQTTENVESALKKKLLKCRSQAIERGICLPHSNVLIYDYIYNICVTSPIDTL